MNNQSYPYAMGRVRAVERKMLTRGQFDRMIEARSAEDAFRILHEAEYGGAEPDAQFAARDYERVLEAEGGKLAAFIAEISPEPGLLNIFLLRFDYHNLKVLLKAEFQNIAGDLLLSASGVIPPEKLTHIVRERTFSDLPAPMAAGAEDAIGAYMQSVTIQAPDPQAIDIKLDQAMYAHMLGEAQKLGSPFIEQLIKVYIDIANIGAFLRVREMHKSADFLRAALIPGGGADHGLFARYLQENLDGFTGAMQYTTYGALCADGVRGYLATGSLTAFERYADDYVNAYIQKAKLFPAGLEIIAAYYVARQAEIKNVRIVMVGKINDIAQDVIRERLRECYV